MLASLVYSSLFTGASFMVAALKYLSYGSQVSLILTVTSAGPSVVVFHLVWNLPSSWSDNWFSVETWTFWVLGCLMWVFCSDFLPPCSGGIQGLRGRALHCWQVQIGVQVLPQPPFTPQYGGKRFLFTAGQRYEFKLTTELPLIRSWWDGKACITLFPAGTLLVPWRERRGLFLFRPS